MQLISSKTINTKLILIASQYQIKWNVKQNLIYFNFYAWWNFYLSDKNSFTMIVTYNIQTFSICSLLVTFSTDKNLFYTVRIYKRHFMKVRTVLFKNKLARFCIHKKFWKYDRKSKIKMNVLRSLRSINTRLHINIDLIFCLISKW